MATASISRAVSRQTLAQRPFIPAALPSALPSLTSVRLPTGRPSARPWRAEQTRRRGGAVAAVDVAAGSAATSDEGGLESEMIDWMRSNGLPACKVVLKEKPGATPDEDSIHYVAAAEDLQAGEVPLKVPDNLIVTLGSVLGDDTLAELLTTNKLSELACLALYLMFEKKGGDESFWRPFIAELDRQRGRGQSAVETPLLWAPEEVAELFKGSPMQREVEARLAGIRREYEELDTVWFMAGSLFKQYPYDAPSETFSFPIFKQAFIAVQSCVVHLQGVSLARRFALIPLGPPLLAYRSTTRSMLAASEGGGVELRLDRPVKKGEPLSVWCGPQPNTRLLLNYGIVDEDNPYDRLTVQAALNPDDPLYQAKRAIVQKNDRLKIQDFQLYKGKEAEAILDMMPYLRLAHVTDALDMDSVQFAQGPVSPCNEKAVLDQLELYFVARLEAYPTTMDEDTAAIADPATNPKRRVAARLVRIEKEILSNALAAVREIKGVLPGGNEVPCIGKYVPLLQ
eukprot:TRINITY_DN5206_c0_g1_i2.p1 TRINITY_DN5206_c0_g1~~TRINITY_DN5206_c0_g1_i2.p1  ORF type:complete len:512 (-),score=17.11 TRINITY_DN5206_c0_g1_i2:292-1827(-)